MAILFAAPREVERDREVADGPAGCATPPAAMKAPPAHSLGVDGVAAAAAAAAIVGNAVTAVVSADGADAFSTRFARMDTRRRR